MTIPWTSQLRLLLRHESRPTPALRRLGVATLAVLGVAAPCAALDPAKAISQCGGRSDKGYWEQIEGYIRDHSEADFTHGLCPSCVRLLYPDLADQVLGGTRGGRDSSRSS